MNLTIEVEWTGTRTQAVIDVLDADDGKLTRQLKQYAGPGAPNVIRLNWSPEELITALRLMSTWLGVSDLLVVQSRKAGDYGDVIAQQHEVHGALRDIFGYVEQMRLQFGGPDLIVQERMEL